MKKINQILTTAALLLIVESCGRSAEVVAEEKKIVYVDSVWVKGPGQINNMQVDPVYFARTTEGRIHQTRSRIQVGDSFVYIFRKMK